jgi:hypothetical protein
MPKRKSPPPPVIYKDFLNEYRSKDLEDFVVSDDEIEYDTPSEGDQATEDSSKVADSGGAANSDSEEVFTSSAFGRQKRLSTAFLTLRKHCTFFRTGTLRTFVIENWR